MKRTAPLLAALLSLSLLLAACGGSPASPTAAATPTTAAVDGYVFVVRGTTVAMNVPAAPVLEKLGAWQSYNEAPSCAYQGMDKTYTYPGFQVVTYTMDEVDYVASVLLQDDTLSTPEGLFIGASLDDMKKAYGDGFTQNLGLYTYAKGKMTLSFLYENGKLAQIEYLAKAS